MEERPVKSPIIVPPRIAYTVLGAFAGMVFAAPFILSIDPSGKLIGGAIYGGPIGLLIGYLLGRRKS